MTRRWYSHIPMDTHSSDLFDWRNGRGSTTMQALEISNFPKDGFYVRSTRTGRTVKFTYDAEVMEANEWFDGERAAYRSPEGTQIFINA